MYGRYLGSNQMVLLLGHDHLLLHHLLLMVSHQCLLLAHKPFEEMLDVTFLHSVALLRLKLALRGLEAGPPDEDLVLLHQLGQHSIASEVRRLAALDEAVLEVLEQELLIQSQAVHLRGRWDPSQPSRVLERQKDRRLVDFTPQLSSLGTIGLVIVDHYVGSCPLEPLVQEHLANVHALDVQPFE
jgi:hypothetical protein